MPPTNVTKLIRIFNSDAPLEIPKLYEIPLATWVIISTWLFLPEFYNSQVKPYAGTFSHAVQKDINSCNRLNHGERDNLRNCIPHPVQIVLEVLKEHKNNTDIPPLTIFVVIFCIAVVMGYSDKDSEQAYQDLQAKRYQHKIMKIFPTYCGVDHIANAAEHRTTCINAYIAFFNFIPPDSFLGRDEHTECKDMAVNPDGGYLLDPDFFIFPPSSMGMSETDESDTDTEEKEERKLPLEMVFFLHIFQTYNVTRMVQDIIKAGSKKGTLSDTHNSTTNMFDDLHCVVFVCILLGIERQVQAKILHILFPRYFHNNPTDSLPKYHAFGYLAKNIRDEWVKYMTPHPNKNVNRNRQTHKAADIKQLYRRRFWYVFHFNRNKYLLPATRDINISNLKVRLPRNGSL